MRSERDENILKPIYSANVKAKFYFQNSDNVNTMLYENLCI